MEELTAQTRLLCRNHIESKEQLLDFQNGLNQEISTLLDSRKSLYHRLRWCKNESQKTEYKEQIAELSKKLSLLRREVKLCEGILSRSENMKQKLLQVRQDKTHHRKEEKEYEQRSRRSGSNRQYES